MRSMIHDCGLWLNVVLGEEKYAEAMLIAYNAKNKYRLPIKKLYGSQRDEELDDEETDDDSAAIWK